MQFNSRMSLQKIVGNNSYGLGLKMNCDGVYISYGALMGNDELNKRAEKFLPPSFNRDILKMNLEDAIKNYQAPDINKEGNFAQMEEDFKNFSGDSLVVPSGFFGIFERGFNLMGWEQFMTEIALRRDLVEELLDKITDYKVEVAKRKIALGFKIGHHGDDLGSQVGPFFSEKMFVEIFKPRLARLFKVFKDAGLPVAMHSCGNVAKYLPHLIDIGLDVLETVQPCNNLEFIKREYGKDLTFWGGIDTQSLPFLTPEEVKQMAAETIRILGKGGGYIIAPTQEIMKDIPLENVKALVETIIQERERVLG